MKKVLLIVGVVVVLSTLVVGSFAGGLVIGRITTQTTSTVEFFPPPEEEGSEETETPPTASNSGEVTEDPEPAPEATEAEPLQPDDGDPSLLNYELLSDVLGLLEEQYYGEIPDRDELAYGAIRGMLMTLDDPYTSFIEPSIATIINEDATGEFEGIGAMVSMREDGYLEIASLIPGQPAEGAGVRAGDIIVAVGDQSNIGLGLYEAISFIRGPAGTDADLEIIRPGEQERVFITVTRAKIEMPIIEAELLDDDIAYVRLTEFDANSAERVELALEDLQEEAPKALIFDLRDNPGGWLNQAIGVADVFLDEGLVAIQRDSDGREQRFPSADGDIGEEIPMVVLVNGGSASASEIVAGALQDRDRAVLIGTQTLGKGSVQLPNNLDDGSQLRVTIARWFTPDEQDLNGNGLTPDVEVFNTQDTPAGEDPQLDRAIEYLDEAVDGGQ